MASVNKTQQDTKVQKRTPKAPSNSKDRRPEGTPENQRQDGTVRPADPGGLSPRKGERHIADVDRKVRGGDA